MQKVAFVAYPGANSIVSEAIKGAAELARSKPVMLHPWPEMKVLGLKIDEEIRSDIAKGDLLAADITYPNMNVFYEIGYAAALGKPVVPLVNLAVERAQRRVVELGLFDTIGYAGYANAEDIDGQLQRAPDTAWSNTSPARRKNHGQPLFILDTQKKIDFRNSIFRAVINSAVQFRAFDPSEIPRLTAAEAIAEVSSSAGVIVPLLSEDIVDSERNNLRAAFIIGLCHGFEVECLAIQYENAPAPLDYRDFITNSTYGHETTRHVEDFAKNVLIWNQSSSSRERRLSLGLLSGIDLGSPMAENETQRLGDYFIRTAAFVHAVRAEGAIVTGRKGSGKSAIYLQIVEELARDRQTCIVDLRPASHNLSEMREAILSVASAGIFGHTIASFWQFVLYMEILLKLREMALPRSRNDSDLQARIRKMEDLFKLTNSVVAGDFTSRLQTAVDKVIHIMGSIEDSEQVRSQITNTMFEQVIPSLRDEIVAYGDISRDVVVLIDDLDKGWPPRRVESHDVHMVRYLAEALNRIQRDLKRRNFGVRHLIFLRSDMYERLVAETSDRGKYNLIKVDWSDREQLRHLLRERVVSMVEKDKEDEAWQAINPAMSGADGIDMLIDNSLRRPRFLIELCEKTISCAMNRGHAFVKPEDVEEGLRLMARYLVSDFGYEMRDVTGAPEDILYAFIGSSEQLSEGEIAAIVAKHTNGLELAEIIELLLWYGFLGFVGENTPVFIYDVEYDYRRLEAERTRLPGEVRYVVNPAFRKGLVRAG